jgi:hypothetical protein
MSITNLKYLKALSHENPDSGYAKLFGYKEDNGKALFTKNTNGALPDFTKFGSEPSIANEFLEDFYNKITAQHIVNLFEKKPLDALFVRFLKTYGKVGDIEEYITSKLQAVTDYDSDTTPTNPFEVKKPSVVLSFIKTEDKTMTFVTLNYEQWYGAFINAYGLDNLASQILANLKEAVDLDIFYKIVKDLGDTTKFTKTKTLTSKVTKATASECYREILELMKKMELPSKTGEYNPASLQNAGTPKNHLVLFLNSACSSQFAVNVLASLFNSNKIDIEWTTIDFDETASDVIGILMDDRSYVYGYRINFTQSIMNPRNMYINTFHHRWTKRGVVPFYNAVIIKEPNA